MNVFIIFTLYLISVTGESTSEVTAGGGIRIKCKYQNGYETNMKYFCKGKGTSCADQIKTDDKNTWVHEGRFSLYDNTSAKVFWVLMRNLTVEDTGTYQCGVDKYLQIDTYTKVKVKVKADLNYGRSISETGYRGGTVNISCKYPESQRSDPKFLCKIVGNDVCAYKTSVKESDRWINEGCMSLYDDRTTLLFTVTIRELTGSGTYWCGAESDWESDHGYEVYITQIYLTVTEPQVPVPSGSSSCLSPRATVLTTSKTTVTSSPTIDTSTDIAVSITTPSPHLSSHFSPQATQLTTSSSSTPTSSSSPATGSPSSTVISVLSVILVLLLMGTSFLIVTLRKRRKTQVSFKGQSFHDSSHSYEVPLGVYDYEEIKDTRSPSVSDIGESTVYSTVCLPTNPSDPSQIIYAQIQLPTHPSDTSSPIYTLAQPSSHTHDMIIYSTANLPTIPSGPSVGHVG
ncbi:uncharacterized protein LOC143486089 isoform X1 [Brachyhypopomus gauderio]|uniref:uncharacterized protein LOC143486089 isoform X1 n=1 Tax=Brachyhypopomus gauderio TaxID=698409 RepID=UPI00404287AE